MKEVRILLGRTTYSQLMLCDAQGLLLVVRQHCFAEREMDKSMQHWSKPNYGRCYAQYLISIIYLLRCVHDVAVSFFGWINAICLHSLCFTRTYCWILYSVHPIQNGFLTEQHASNTTNKRICSTHPEEILLCYYLSGLQPVWHGELSCISSRHFQG